MSEPSLPESTSQAATAWVARLASKKATHTDVRRLKDWLAADPLHRQAFDEARRLWVGLGPFEGAMVKDLSHRRRRVATTLAAAACLLLAVLVPWFMPHDLVSPVGEVNEVSLSDGSRVWLDSGAVADFRDGADTRTLEMVRGRIHIAVAHDDRRPLVVKANGAIIRDIGTAFTVDTEGEQLEVAVVEGSVEVKFAGASTVLEAGRAAAFIDGQPSQPTSVNAAREPAWREGRIVLDRTSLAAALHELDRYRPGRILLLDAEAGKRTVSGSMSIRDIDGGLQSLADSERLRLIHLPLLVIVTTAPQ